MSNSRKQPASFFCLTKSGRGPDASLSRANARTRDEISSSAQRMLFQNDRLSEQLSAALVTRNCLLAFSAHCSFCCSVTTNKVTATIPAISWFRIPSLQPMVGAVQVSLHFDTYVCLFLQTIQFVAFLVSLCRYLFGMFQETGSSFQEDY